MYLGAIMAKRSDVTLMSPPRYARNDPRNQARVKAGHLLSLQLGGYDYPIRKLRRVGEMCCVTLPPQVREFLALKRGDWLIFGSTPWRGVVAFIRVTDEQYPSLTLADSEAQRRMARKVQGRKSTVFVNIPAAIRKILSAEPGDLLHFGLRSKQSVVNICAIKAGGDPAGSRRTG
ncbi:hypothetical protein ES703_37916 [subsurface metagenome]